MWARAAGRLGVLATGVLLLITGNTAAAAAAGRPMAADEQMHKGGGPFSWIEITDSNDIEIWMYGLSLDDGGITEISRAFWAMLTELFWNIYQALVNLSIWFVDWVMSLGWLNVVASPILAIGDAVHELVDRLGLVPALLTITAIVAVIAMARGRWATGIFDLGLSLVIAAIATGVLAQPVAMVAGADGWIAQTHTGGMQLASALSGDDSSTLDADGLREHHAERLSDVFIVQPLQMTNFGKTLSDKCTKVHADATRAFQTTGGKLKNAEKWQEYNEGESPRQWGRPDVQWGSGSDMVREQVGDCDKAAGEYAGDPDAGMGMAALVFIPAGLVIMGLAVLVGGATILAGISVLVQALKAIFHLVTGLLPGPARGPLLLSVSEVVMSLVILLTSTIVLEALLLVIEAIFDAGDEADAPAIKTFAIADIVLVVGLVMVWRWRKNLKASSSRLAAWLGRRPGAPPARVPHQDTTRRSAGSMARPMIQSLMWRRAIRRRSNTGGGRQTGHDAGQQGGGQQGKQPGRPPQPASAEPPGRKPVDPPPDRKALPSADPAASSDRQAASPGPRPPRPGVRTSTRMPVTAQRRPPTNGASRPAPAGPLPSTGGSNSLTASGRGPGYKRAFGRDDQVVLVPEE